MQLIPEQSAISMFKPSLDDNVTNSNSPLSTGSGAGAAANSNDFERVSPGTLLEQLKYNRYSNSSLDSGQGSDSIKVSLPKNKLSPLPPPLLSSSL